jgi:hypothetical protein
MQAMSAQIKIPDDVRCVLARCTITATSIKLPIGKLDDKLYARTKKLIERAGGKWERFSGAHVFACNPMQALGLAVEKPVTEAGRVAAGVAKRFASGECDQWGNDEPQPT